MLITDKDEIIRLKLTHSPFKGNFIEFAETYTVLRNYTVQTNTFVLIQNKGIRWSIHHIEQNDRSLQNKWGSYSGRHIGQEKYIKRRWKGIIYKARPISTWQIEHYNEYSKENLRRFIKG